MSLSPIIKSYNCHHSHLLNQYRGVGTPKIHNGDEQQQQQQHTNTPILFTPIKVNDIILKNRIIVSPMCLYSCVDGEMNDFHLVHYGSLAKSGCAMIILEATAVLPNGRITYADSGLWKDSQIEPLKRIVHFIHNFGCYTAIQLSHAGVRGSSEIPFIQENQQQQLLKDTIKTWDTWNPNTMTLNDIKIVVESFQQSTRRAVEAGFDAIEINAAHGYLLCGFLSRTTNSRTDEYGGEFNNRIRLLLDIIKVVKIECCGSGNRDTNHNSSNAATEIPIFVRVSVVKEDIHSMDECIRLCEILKREGVRVIDWVSREPERVRATGILTSTVGNITNGHQAEQLLEQGKADFIMVGREHLKNFPLFTYNASKDLNVNINGAIPQYSSTFRD
ncbi:hypothetical protein CYY_003205 [Polysphondylium violaceum]|uniref:NADH:flavin oxidoreductase/NADH oxidase N-terminal domain-containing protein n=1 Tax=Polysphondylium violaceum TaxID=133409 RepID=A0A8J4PV29_9MYCE|nr:hypothetical protein CYY_003205 [Polysphondylium violaceum]